MPPLRAHVAAVRKACRSIPDVELPRLFEQLARTANPSLFAALLFSPGAPGFMTIATLTGAADPLRAMIVAPFITMIFVVNNAWARTKHGLAHFNGPLFATALGIAAGFTGLAWTSGARVESLVTMVVVVPAIIAMFVPWRPIFAGWSTLLTMASLTASSSLIHGYLVWPDPLLIVVAVCIGGTSAVGQQVTRLQWLDLERAKTQLLASDRMSSLGRMTAGIAHELKTPLAAIQNALEAAGSLSDELGRSIGHEEVTDDDLREIAHELGVTLASLGTSASRATSFVQAIRNHGSSGGLRGGRVPFAVGDRVAAVLGLLSFRLRSSQVVVAADAIDDTAIVFGDPVKFDQVITNLLSNALDACEESGTGTSIRLSGQVIQGRVVVAVQDDGPGVPADIVDRLFDSLFTTRAEGTGLGLPISRDLMRGEFGGNLSLVPSPRGARFEATCPAVAG